MHLFQTILKSFENFPAIQAPAVLAGSETFELESVHAATSDGADYTIRLKLHSSLVQCLPPLESLAVALIPLRFLGQA
jgi:hypothetical protein